MALQEGEGDAPCMFFPIKNSDVIYSSLNHQRISYSGREKSMKEDKTRRTIPLLLVMILMAAGFPQIRCGKSPDEGHVFSAINIVVDGELGSPAQFGLDRFRQAFEAQGLSVSFQKDVAEERSADTFLIGTLSESKRIEELKSSGNIPLSDKNESLAVQRVKDTTGEFFVIAGADDRGLMYALLEIARQIELSPTNRIGRDAILDVSESPLVPVRSMAVFLHNQDDEREWYYSKAYWEEYLGMLAEHRWNTFNLVFSHQTPYLAPMYPFHVRVDEFPEVQVKGLSDPQREKNLEMLRFISSLAKERGLDFTLSVWQQIAWGVGTHTRAQESMVSGYNEDNMTEYTYLALSKLLKECPGITGLQLRLNYESGVTYEDQPAFFRDAVFRAAKEAGRPILIEVRDIGLLSETLDAARATGLPVRVSHKYWAEHMVFPYHPARFVWTYSYGDWLRYPRQTDHIYQVWSLGSHRLLQWGDPEYVRRFAPTTTFEDGVGFEICAPLSQKGFGNAPGAWRIFRDSDREYYKWEFQRYWSYYGLFGRLTYNPETGDGFWMRELEKRFGSKAAEKIAQASRSASRILPFISGMAIGNFNMGTWPEKDMGGLINYYLTLRPYDRARITGFLEYVDDVLAGRSSGKMSPLDVADRLEFLAAATDDSLSGARSLVQGAEKEFWAADMDFRILSGMARYFSQKIRATTKLGFYYRTGDIAALREAVRYAENALEIWKNLSLRAAEIYSANLVFGPGSVGHWKDGIRYVEDDLKQLKYQEKIFEIRQEADYAFDFGPRPFSDTTSTWSSTYTNDFMIEPRFQGVSPSTQYTSETGFGWIQSRDLTAREPESVGGYVWSGAARHDGELPGNALLGDFIQGQDEAVFRIDLPEGHYQVTAVLSDQSQNPIDHGPMSVIVVERFGERPIMDREILPAGQTIIKRFNINMIGERFINFRIKFSADPGADFIVSSLLFTRVEPHISHVPLRKAKPGLNLNISACVSLPPAPNDEHPLTSLGIITSNASTLEIPEEVTRVTLKYSTDSGQNFRTLEMKPSKAPVYAAVLPAGTVQSGEILYYFEAEDSTGQVTLLPKPDTAQVYFLVDVSDDDTAPSVEHEAVSEHPAGQPLAIEVKVTDESEVSQVLLYYRPTRQTMEYSVVRMDRRGDKYSATIPGGVITDEFDIMYYFEAFDQHGNACLFPDPDKTQPYFVVKVKRSGVVH